MWKFGWQEEGQGLVARADSDWGGSREDRKSTSGGVLVLVAHCIMTWSSTQGAIALSSAEAEFYAMVDCVLKAKWVGTIAKEMGFGEVDKVLVLGTDSAAAKSFVSRRGLGRMRHIEVRDLWLQAELAAGKVKVIKVKGDENPADLMTKFLRVEEIKDRLERMGVRVEPRKRISVVGGRG